MFAFMFYKRKRPVDYTCIMHITLLWISLLCLFSVPHSCGYHRAVKYDMWDKETSQWSKTYDIIISPLTRKIAHSFRLYCSVRKSLPSNIKYKSHLSRQHNYWSHRCSWSIACWRCFIYISILDLTPGFSGLSKDNYETRQETFKFWDLVRL